jgi:hypothetical protein
MNERVKRPAGLAVPSRDGGDDVARAAKLRRSGWLLGLLAIGFYLGFIAWNLFRASSGS